MTDVFISYQRSDRESAREIAEHLAESFKVWWDIELLAGDRFAEEINAVLSSARLIIVLWTPESVKSTWVNAEASIGLQRKNLVPIELRPTSIPVPFNAIHTLRLNLVGNRIDPVDLKTIEESVRKRLGKPSSAAARTTREEIAKVLDEPQHEVEFWVSISSASTQKIGEYELYLKRYGQDAAFANLARSRIEELRLGRRRLPEPARAIATAGMLMGIVVGGLTIANLLGLFERQEPLSVEAPASVRPRALDDVANDEAIPKVETPKRNASYQKFSEKDALTPASKKVIVRVYASNSEAKRVINALKDFPIDIESRSRNDCLSGTPVTSIWPDKSIPFEEFRLIVLALMDSGFKFYVIYPKKKLSQQRY